MQKVYLVNVFTGAECQGVYSTLENAQEAVAAHYLAIGGEKYYKFKWNGNQYMWGADNTPDGLMKGIWITEFNLDEELPLV